MPKFVRIFLSEINAYRKVIFDAIKIKRDIARYNGIITPLSPCSNNPKVLATYQHEVANLESALDNKESNIKNIAVAGPYGAGKSTFILSFERYYSKYKYLNISLATFLESAILTSQSKTKNSSNEVLSNKEIEESIVQHILYKEHPSKTPASSYKRIPHAFTSKRIWFSIVAFCTLLSSLFLFIQNQKSPTTIAKKTIQLLVDTVPSIEYIALSIIGYCIFILLFWFSHIALTFNFRRIFTKDGTVAISDESSPLNKHLDEIIYFFFKTNYNVVVFEDLDRFNNVSIFTKLREINHLLNQSKFINQDVKFVYAIKDELLNAKERTKFFDLIIPILPIVHPNNALSVFQRELSGIKFNDKKLLEIIEPSLLKNISRYIDDMRILKNICNEYLSYINKLNNEVDCDHNKIFAMVIFKNLCPKQHSELLIGKGAVAQIFKSLPEAKNNTLVETLEETTLLKTTLSDKEDLVIQTKEEIFYVYWRSFLIKNNYHEDNIDKFKTYDNEVITRDNILLYQEDFEVILNTQKDFRVFDRYSNEVFRSSDRLVTYKDIDNSRSKSYDTLIKLLDVDILEIKEKINVFEKLKTRIHQQNLKEFLTEHPLSEIVSTCKSSNNCTCGLNWLNSEELPSLATSYLLIEGYLAEDYPDFLSVFVEGALTSSDKNKLNSIRAGHELDSDYKFTKLDSVVDDLTSRDFRLNRNLNHQLVDFISARIMSDTGKEKDVNIWTELFNKTNSNSKKLVSFIIEHFVIYPKSKLICAIKKYSESTLVLILDDIVFEPKLTKLLIEQLSIDELKELFAKLRKNHVDYIDNIEDFSSVCGDDSEYSEDYLCKKLSLLGVKFNQLREDLLFKDDYILVLTFNIFTFNLYMIRAIRNSVLEGFELGDDEQITFAQLEIYYSDEMSSLDSDMFLKQIEENINDFVINVLCEQEYYSEPLEIFIIKLNQLDLQLGSSMIESSDTEVIDISLINAKEHWCLLLDNKKVKPEWNNIYACLMFICEGEEDLNFDMNVSLQKYIQLDSTITGLEDSYQELENLDTDFLLNNLLNFKNVPANVYEKLLPLFPSTNLYSNTDLLLSINKAKALIDNKLLDYSSNLVNWLIDEEQEILLFDYIIQYTAEYYQDSNSELLLVEVFDMILKSNLVAFELKTLYLKDILFNRYSEISDYEILLPTMMETIEGIDFEVMSSFNIPTSLLIDMLEINNQKFEVLRTKLVASQVDNLSWIDLVSTLSSLNSMHFKSFISGTGNISIPKGENFNIELLNALHKKGYVGKIKEQYFTYLGYTLKSKIPK